jgi:hypothetical protein
MKNIELTKEVKQKEFAKKYYNKRFEDLNDPQSLVCSAAAEIFAYIDNVIPEGVRKHTIFDFNGFYFDAITKDKKNILTDEVAVEVRNLICKYCWDVSWEEIKARGGTKEEKMAFLRKHSVIMDRFEKGNNVVVYGESVGRPLGRTLVASIIMKEAIKQRLSNRQKGQIYDWTDFSVLREIIRNRSDELYDYKSCEWLVVDNITKDYFKTDYQKSYMSELVNPFFLDRIAKGRVTILIFKFDITDELFSIEENMGVGLYSIVNSRKTFKIQLG